MGSVGDGDLIPLVSLIFLGLCLAVTVGCCICMEGAKRGWVGDGDGYVSRLPLCGQESQFQRRKLVLLVVTSMCVKICVRIKI